MAIAFGLRTSSVQERSAVFDPNEHVRWFSRTSGRPSTSLSARRSAAVGKKSRAKRERQKGQVLYHFTSTMHLPLIERAGFIRTTESNLSFLRGHAGPDVVWLMDSDSADGATHGLDGSVVDKKAVRITVRVQAERWTEWVKRQPGYDPLTAASLVRTGGGTEAASHWWVTEQPIPREQWLRVEVKSDV